MFYDKTITDTVVLGRNTLGPPARPRQTPAQVIHLLLSRALPCLLACHLAHPLPCSLFVMPDTCTASQRHFRALLVKHCNQSKSLTAHPSNQSACSISTQACAAGCCRQQTILMRSGGYPVHASTLQRLLFVPDMQRPLL